MSETSGANTAEVPSRPDSTPSETQNCQNSSAKAAPTMPAGRPAHAIITGNRTLNWSARRPIITPPTPAIAMNTR